MGSKKNRRQQTRRSVEAKTLADKTARLQAKEYLAAKQRTQEQIEMEKAYGELDDDLPFDFSTSVDRSEIPPITSLRDRFVVQLQTDHGLPYPELYLNVYVADTKDEEAAFAEMLARAGCSRAESLDEADLCVFTGGADIDPEFYGERPHPLTKFSKNRDAADNSVFDYCLERGIPMFGVCRGAQFLHVRNGGKLYQDVDNHFGDHAMLDTASMDFVQKVSSTHHQLCIKNPNMKILGTASVSTKRWFDDKEFSHGKAADVEAFWYSDTLCLGVQGHPEYRNYQKFTIWCLQKIYEHVILNDDLEWKDGTRRLKDELLEKRVNRRTKTKESEGV